jgi:hypothetical protein
MLHLLHLALAPIFILRKKIILPLALGGAVFLIHFRFERSRVSLITGKCYCSGLLIVVTLQGIPRDKRTESLRRYS